MVPEGATTEASGGNVEFTSPSRPTQSERTGRGLVITAYVVGGVGFLIPFVFGPIALVLGAIAQSKRFPNALGALILGIVCTVWGGFVLYIGLTRDTLG